MKITKVTKKNFPEWVVLGIEFWSKHPKESIEKDFKRMLGSKNEQSFICTDNDNPVGFINISIRTDYVEGSKTNPAGYLEGIYRTHIPPLDCYVMSSREYEKVFVFK